MLCQCSVYRRPRKHGLTDIRLSIVSGVTNPSHALLGVSQFTSADHVPRSLFMDFREYVFTHLLHLSTVVRDPVLEYRLVLYRQADLLSCPEWGAT